MSNPPAMTSAEWTARAEALEEAARHLDLNWTDDPLEFKQGGIVAKGFTARAKYCRLRARERQ